MMQIPRHRQTNLINRLPIYLARKEKKEKVPKQTINQASMKYRQAQRVEKSDHILANLVYHMCVMTINDKAV